MIDTKETSFYRDFDGQKDFKNKTILSKYIGFMDLYINNNKLLFKDMNNNIVFEFEIME